MFVLNKNIRSKKQEELLNKTPANNRSQQKKVLILSCGTGGGHNSAAKAIQEDLQDKGIKADFIEYLDIINPKIKDKVNNLYIKTTQKNGKVFKVVYHLGEMYQKTKIKSPVYALNFLNKRRLYRFIKENGYQYIVTTHLFAAQTLTAIKKEYPIKFIAVATDYVCIPFWQETNPDYFIIPSSELEKDFEEKGIAKEKILPYGIPTSKEYRKVYDKKKCREKLDLKESEIYLLILTGSMGFGNVTEMLTKLKEELPKIHYIVACGNNKELLKTVQEQNKTEDSVIALPYTDQISEYMKSSDIILTKPGGLTSTEIATLRKPFIHTMPIPGCENYNADFFSKRNMSIQCNSVKEIADDTKKLINDLNKQEEMIKNQEKYIHRNTCDSISKLIINEINIGG